MNMLHSNQVCAMTLFVKKASTILYVLPRSVYGSRNALALQYESTRFDFEQGTECGLPE